MLNAATRTVLNVLRVPDPAFPEGYLVSQIRKIMGCDYSTVRRAMNKAVVLGFVTCSRVRLPHPRGAAYRWRLTWAGRAILAWPQPLTKIVRISIGPS